MSNDPTKESTSDGTAKVLDNKTLTEIERLFIKAKAPEKAIAFYVRYKLWDRAIQVANDYAPNRKAELEREKKLDANGGNSGSANSDKKSSNASGSELCLSLTSEADKLRLAGDYAGAVDTLLQIDLKTFNLKLLSSTDKEKLTHAWRAGVKLANERVPGKTASVVAEVAFRLRSIGEPSAADDLLQVHGVDANSTERYVPSVRSKGDAAFVRVQKSDKTLDKDESDTGTASWAFPNPGTGRLPIVQGSYVVTTYITSALFYRSW